MSLLDQLASAGTELGGGIADVMGKAWDELAPIVEHGAHESAAPLWRGEAFVMYPGGGGGAEQQIEAPQAQVEQPQIEAPQQQIEHEGREM